jgi:hypothetical protein
VHGTANCQAHKISDLLFFFFCACSVCSPALSPVPCVVCLTSPRSRVPVLPASVFRRPQRRGALSRAQLSLVWSLLCPARPMAAARGGEARRLSLRRSTPRCLARLPPRLRLLNCARPALRSPGGSDAAGSRVRGRCAAAAAGESRKHDGATAGEAGGRLLSREAATASADAAAEQSRGEQSQQPSERADEEQAGAQTKRKGSGEAAQHSCVAICLDAFDRRSCDHERFGEHTRPRRRLCCF